MSEVVNRIESLSPRMLEFLVRSTHVDVLEYDWLEMILPRDPSGPCPLSYAQERLWFLDQLQPGNIAYNLPLLLALDGEVNLRLLERALNELVARHESLRTTFAVMGSGPVQRIAATQQLEIEEVVLPAWAGSNELQQLVNEAAAQPFDLQRGPLLRVQLLRQPGSALLLLNMHHIISDGWSLGVLERELRSLYEALQEGRAAALKELRIQYADFAVWQREWLQGERLAEELRYGREQLAGVPPLLELPCDYPRPAVESYRGAVQSFGIGERHVGPLREWARTQQATLFMVLLALFQALLARYSGQADIVVGSPIANRNRAELEDLIGFFVNMLVLRSRVTEEMTLAQLLEQVREVTVRAYEHQDLPFEKLVEELQLRRSLSHSPLFQVAFVLQNTPASESQPGVEVPEPQWEQGLSYLKGTAKFDLTLYLEERGNGLLASCEYRTDLFEHGTISRMMQRYVQLLEAGGRNPELRLWQLPLTIPGEPTPAPTVESAEIGPALAQYLGVDEESRVALLDDADDTLRLMAEVITEATGARPLREPAAATHLLLSPEALAGLSPDSVALGTVIVVVGLPWFATSLEGWEQHKVLGLWSLKQEGVLCVASVTMEGSEGVLDQLLAGGPLTVLNQRQQLQPIDLSGELYVSGTGTGLRSRRRADGRIEVSGRESQLVRVGGLQVDPGRLESFLRQQGGVQEAAVRVRWEEAEPYLLAWVVRRPTARKEAKPRQRAKRISEAELMRGVGETLTAGLLPRRIVLTAQLPQNDEEAVLEIKPPPQAPRTPTEAVIARIWAEVLKQPQNDVHANFFDLGGNSVSSVQVISRMRDALHVDLPLHHLFNAPTIAALASLCQAEQELIQHHGESDDASTSEVTDPDWSGTEQIRRAPPGPRRIRGPLSYAQERLWFLDQFEPASSLYNMHITIQLEAAADPHLVQRVLQEIGRRHEALRTTFPSLGGLPQQVIQTADTTVPVPLTILSDLNPIQTDAEVMRIATSNANEPFDLAHGPVWRARLVRAGDRYSCLSLVIHHIVFDGWSFGLLMREFRTLYQSFKQGQESPFEDLSVQYTDFARWQRRWLAEDRFKSHMDYWRQQFGFAPELLNLPTDRPRPLLEAHRGATQTFSIPQPALEAVRALGRACGATLFSVLLAVFKTLLMRWSGQEDIIVGAPIANRTRVEVENLIGFFANTLALRTDLSGNPTFVELLERVHRTSMAASEHQEIPFEKIVEELQPKRSLNHNPIFQVMLVLQNMPEGQDSLSEYVETWQAQRPAGDFEGKVTYRTAKFDITLFFIESKSGLLVNFEYNTDLFDDATITRMMSQFKGVVETVASDPNCRIWAIPLMKPTEETNLIEALRGAEATVVSETVVDMVERQARETPSAPAVISTARVLSYERLNAIANRLARRLQRLRIGPGDRVAISMSRGTELLLAVLGVLKAGAAYVPIDPSYPKARQSFMLSDSCARLLLCDVERGLGSTCSLELASVDAIAPEESEDDLDVSIEAASPAYVIFTSGSTGQPKGVVMPHEPLANLIRWQTGNTSHPQRTLQFTSLSFDVSFQELFSTWSTGGTLVVIDEDTRKDPIALWQSLIAYRIERIFMPYVALQQLAEVARDSELPLPPLREVITAGEQLRITPAIAELFERLNGCVLRNQYGPTESHVTTEFVLTEDPARWPSLPPIGKPITNTSIRILDRYLNPVPLGVAGEIYLAGECLALGYLDRPEQTAERFVPDRWSDTKNTYGARMYRTGDLGKLLPDGNIEFMGRIDDQLKIRGYRIEPFEIELALTQIPEVDEAVVVALGDSGSDKRLVAYVQSRLDTDAIRESLVSVLPAYMIPALIVTVESLPLTASGKIDREALRRSVPVLSTNRASFEPPSTPLERMLAEQWSELLGLADISVNDSFFNLGGHSLLVTRVLSRIRSAIGLQLPVRSVFESPTIRQLSKIIATEIGERVTATQSEVLLTKLSVYSPETVQASGGAAPIQLNP